METNDMPHIAPRIRAAIEKHGATAGDLAITLDIREEAAEALLAGERGLASEELALIASHYKVSTDDLLFGKKPVALMRADEDADTQAIVSQVEAIFEDYQYVKALVGA